MDKETMLSRGWKSIACSRSDLNINFVLCSGQSFRWKEVDGAWIGVHRKMVWQIKQDDACIWFKVMNKLNCEPFPQKTASKGGRKRKTFHTELKGTKVIKLDENCNHVGDAGVQNVTKANDLNEEEVLRDYFQLDVDLGALCKSWEKIDDHFASIHKDFPGVRMLRQDPIENLFSFICSSNNNITRIASMIEKMCEKFGEEIYKHENDIFYAFPSVDKLAKSNTENILRGLGFGYRSKYIHQAAVEVLSKGGEAWLFNLRSLPYGKAHSELVNLSGIGAKVADCICMMSLDKPEAIPVDTHVWQIAVRDYKISTLKNTKTLTTTSYKAIGEHFRNLWGDYASWAMNFLFVADLKQFKLVKK